MWGAVPKLKASIFGDQKSNLFQNNLCSKVRIHNNDFRDNNSKKAYDEGYFMTKSKLLVFLILHPAFQIVRKPEVFSSMRVVILKIFSCISMKVIFFKPKRNHAVDRNLHHLGCRISTLPNWDL